MDALGELYDCSAHLIYGQALWYTRSAADAADVTQDVFFRLAERASDLNSIRKPLAYMLRMAHTISCDVLRSRKRLAVINEEMVTSTLVEPAGPSSAFEISKLLGELPDLQREALYLRYVAGFSLIEVGKITGVTIFTAASRCRLGIRKLQKLLGEKR